MQISFFSKIALFFASIFSSGSEVPERPDPVPESAYWAGGPDGGSWILCDRSQNNKSYNCTIYNEFDGGVRAKGNYHLRFYSWDDEKGSAVYIDPRTEKEIPDYEAFDGEKIYVKDSHVLLPDGWIDYPTEPGHGIRIRYKDGLETDSVNY